MTRFFRMPALILAAAAALSACAANTPVSRNVPLDFAPVIDVPTQDWNLATLIVDVPRSLTVSEANGIKPRADIVWREDPAGDRHAQVEAIMRAALEPALTPMQGEIPVIITIEMTRFHALTERARYTVGGEQEIEFILTVRHAETGQLLSGPRDVDLTFPGYGGRQAVEAEALGITQRSRILERVASWARTEFPTPPASFVALELQPEVTQFRPVYD